MVTIDYMEWKERRLCCYLSKMENLNLVFFIRMERVKRRNLRLFIIKMDN